MTDDEWSWLRSARESLLEAMDEMHEVPLAALDRDDIKRERTRLVELCIKFVEDFGEEYE